MADLKATRQKFQFALGGLGLLIVIAIAILFSPLVGSEKERGDELRQLGVQLRQKKEQAEKVSDLDKKIALATQQIDSFYKDRLPERDSAISETLGQLAAASGVQMTQVKYTSKDTDAVGLRPVAIEAGFAGDYLQLVKFLNSLERSQLFFIVDGVNLGGEQSNTSTVKLDMKLRTFLKAGA
jgi:Tfp pilus assembly protein PilO